MAEAHQAVAFQFSVTPEGVDLRINRALIRSVLSSWKRSYKLFLSRLSNRAQNVTYPLGPRSYILLCASAFGLRYVKFKPATDLVSYLQKLLQKVAHVPEPIDVCIIVPTITGAVWLTSAFVTQRIIRLLLSYHPWINDPPTRPSRTTIIYTTLLRLLVGKPKLYSLQASLPKLPLPPVHDTIERYLRSVRGLRTDEEYKALCAKAREFEQKAAPRLQRWLFLKWLYAPNYVSDWWEEYIYLHGRSPIMVNSNFYAMDMIFTQSTTDQIARTANGIFISMSYRNQLELDQIKPEIISGAIPLCSAQYERQFNTARVPGIVKDTIVHYFTSSHVVVHHQKSGKFYKLIFQEGDHVFRPTEIEYQLKRLVEDANSGPPANDIERKLGALTAGKRDDWAKARQEFFSHGVNADSLHAIESGAVHIILAEEEPALYDPDDPSKLDKWAKLGLHGNCYDRWFDKSLQLIVFRNGLVASNVEHSWADAPVSGKLFEYNVCKDREIGYDEHGHCKKLGGELPHAPPIPQRLRFETPEALGDIINKQLEIARPLADSVDMHVEIFLHYGKGFIKKCKVSPDGYLQMALQLAHYRDMKRFSLTYESSMTRLYRDGRTETVRSCTEEAVKFVKSFDDPNIPADEKKKMLSVSCDNHQKLFRDAMCGKGVDRHLFCLYVISRYLGVESSFLREVLSEPWRLSTSQTPMQQLFMINFDKNPEAIFVGGGFGPVADDGYGVSYLIAAENYLFFHISSKHTCSETNSLRFGAAIRQALYDMRKLYEPAWVPPAKVPVPGRK